MLDDDRVLEKCRPLAASISVFFSKKLLVCYFTLLASCFFALQLHVTNWNGSTWKFHIRQSLFVDTKTGAKSVSCHIPKLNLWDPTIVKYVNKTPIVLKCDGGYPLFRMMWNPNTTELRLTPKGERFLANNVTCFWQTIQRKPDDKKLTYGKEIVIDSFPFRFNEELIQVVCRNLSKIAVYIDVFGTIVRKNNSKPLNPDDPRWNVLVLGLDSVSYQSFLRFMPKTVDLLQSTSRSHIFTGYHKIGENTLPNLVPMLTGRKLELSTEEKLQLPHNGGFNSYTFDSYPFIWQDFASAGYATGYVEDKPAMNTFNFGRRGFREQPTDHYGRPLFLAYESFKNRKDLIDLGLTYKDKRGKLRELEPSVDCASGRRLSDIFWEYAVHMFTSRYHGVAPMFMFSWNVGVTHDSVVALKIIDSPFSKMLDHLVNGPWADNTFIFIVADHGQRMDYIRKTFVGRMEDRLPFLAVVEPKSFAAKYPQYSAALSANSDKLVTALDIYATFKHILHLGNSSATEELFNDVGPSGYAKSLFTPISAERSCTTAGIPEWWCVCGRYTEMDTSNMLAMSAAEALTQMINDLFSHQVETKRWCATLTPNAVHSLRRRDITDNTTEFRKVEPVKNALFDDYVIQVEMTPGRGLFEATLRPDHSSNPTNWTLVGAIERVNMYGNQSACLQAQKITTSLFDQLRKTCFCQTS